MAAPTETEIRTEIADRMTYEGSGSATRHPGELPVRADLRGVVEDMAQAITAPSDIILEWDHDSAEDMSGDQGLWRDLRPSEAGKLRAIADEAIQRAIERAESAITEELVAAALRFAEAYPDAPRGTRAGPRKALQAA